MTKEEKSLLDMISYAEGTLGVSNNGYDVVVGSKRIIAGWTPNTTIIHGGNDWAITIVGKNGKSVKSTAAGRYQFIYGTWLGDKNSFTGGRNLPMTKDNQNNRALELINDSFKGYNIDKTLLTTNRVMFNRALSRLSTKWASIPNLDGNSNFSSDGVNKATYSSDKLYEIFMKAVIAYS